jgi:hypothetical protein
MGKGIVAEAEKKWNSEAVAADLRRSVEMARSYQDKHRGNPGFSGDRRASIDMSAAEELVASLLKTRRALGSRTGFLERLAEIRNDADRLAGRWKGVFDKQAFPSLIREHVDRLRRKFEEP